MDAAEPIDGGRYRLVELLGSGGMAAVYRAWDGRLQAWRAVKVLNARANGSASVRSRFEDEARAMARLAHRNILTVHEFGLDGDRPFIVMELVPGGSLADVLERKGALRPALACEVVARVLDALQFAHDNQVVHRDIKPHNIMLAADGAPLVADFGIARVGGELDSGRTGTGVMMGTLAYMAPEQRSSARRVDGRADVYAVGNTLYALVTGEEPFDLHAMPDDDEQWSKLPGPLARIVRRATRHAPDARYPSAAAMAAELRQAMPELEGLEGGVASFGVTTLWDSSPPFTPAPVPRRTTSETLDLDALDASPEAPGVTAAPGATGALAAQPTPSPPSPASRRWMLPALLVGGGVAGVGLLAALLAGGVYALESFERRRSAPPEVPPIVQQQRAPRVDETTAATALDAALASRADALATCDLAERASGGTADEPWEALFRVQRSGEVEVELKADYSPSALRRCREEALAGLRGPKVEEPFELTRPFAPTPLAKATIASSVQIRSGSSEVSVGSASAGSVAVDALAGGATSTDVVLDPKVVRRLVGERVPRQARAACIAGARERGVDLSAARAWVVLAPETRPTVRVTGADDAFAACLEAALKAARLPKVIERQEAPLPLPDARLTAD